MFRLIDTVQGRAVRVLNPDIICVCNYLIIQQNLIQHRPFAENKCRKMRILPLAVTNTAINTLRILLSLIQLY